MRDASQITPEIPRRTRHYACRVHQEKHPTPIASTPTKPNRQPQTPPHPMTFPNDQLPTLPQPPPPRIPHPHPLPGQAPVSRSTTRCTACSPSTLQPPPSHPPWPPRPRRRTRRCWTACRLVASSCSLGSSLFPLTSWVPLAVWVPLASWPLLASWSRSASPVPTFWGDGCPGRRRRSWCRWFRWEGFWWSGV